MKTYIKIIYHSSIAAVQTKTIVKRSDTSHSYVVEIYCIDMQTRA